MKKDYIDELIFRAVSLDDVELLIFILSRLSKDDDKDVLKNIANVIYKDNKNVYEYLLENRKNEMLNAFIRLGFWEHVHIAINKRNETMLEVAYRMNNLPIVISLLGNENAVYNENSEDLNHLLSDIKANYQVSFYLLDYINKKVMPVDYPEALTEDKINEHNYEYNKSIIHEYESDTAPEEYTGSIYDEETLEYNTKDEVDYTGTETATIEDSKKDIGPPDLDIIFSNFSKKLGKGFRNLFLKKKENQFMKVEDNILLKNETSQSNEDNIIVKDIPTPKEIKEKINNGKEDLLGDIIKGMDRVEKNSDNAVKKIDFKKDDVIKKKIVLDLHAYLAEHNFNSKKEKINFVLKNIINVFSTDDLVQYRTVKNFISIMSDCNIKVIPKIESTSLSSFEFVFEDTSFSLSSLGSFSMKEIKDVIYINSEEDLFLISEKIAYLEVNNKKGSEYLRLLITKTYLESKNIRDFISRLKDNSIDIETSIKDFSIITATAEELKNLERILTIYKYKKDDVVIDDEDLPEPVRYCEIRDSFKHK